MLSKVRQAFPNATNKNLKLLKCMFFLVYRTYFGILCQNVCIIYYILLYYVLINVLRIRLVSIENKILIRDFLNITAL